MPAQPADELSGDDFAARVGLSRSDLDAVVASAIFDERFYLMTYPDIAEAGINPFEHYLAHGRFEKRWPSAIFSPDAYAAANPEVAASGMEPFLHYVLVGQAAGAPLSIAETIEPRPALMREIASGTGASPTEQECMSRDKIVLAVNVVDNADTLREFIDWHLGIGVDFIVAFDGGSSDGSQDILEHFAKSGVLSWSLQPRKNIDGFDPFAELAKMARDRFGADWILLLDADEFLCVAEADLHDVLQAANKTISRR